MEEWVPLSGFEGFYEISSIGRIRSLSGFKYGVSKKGKQILRKKLGRTLKLDKKINGAGYFGVCLSINGISYYKDVHRLVAVHFIGPPPLKNSQVNHIDGNRLNNHAENLEWVTPSENIQHAKARGARFGKSQPGSKNPKAKLDEVKVSKILLSKKTIRWLANHYKVSRTTILNIKKRKFWRHVKI